MSQKRLQNMFFNDKTNANAFKEFYCYLASDLDAKLPLHLMLDFDQIQCAITIKQI